MDEFSINDIDIAPQDVVLRTARDFAATLAETPEFKAFEQANERLNQDSTAQQAIQVYQRKQQSLRGLIMLNALSETDRAELMQLQESLFNQPAILAYNQAQTQLIESCQEIGDLISESLGLDFGAACKSSGCCG